MRYFAFSSLLQSLRKKYGKLYSLKMGSFKTIFAEDAASVKEVLVNKSADYAGRPPFHSFQMTTLGMCWKHFFIYEIVSLMAVLKPSSAEYSYISENYKISNKWFGRTFRQYLQGNFQLWTENSHWLFTHMAVMLTKNLTHYRIFP